jgi:hypothetical protein
MSQVHSSFPSPICQMAKWLIPYSSLTGCHISWPTVSTTHLWIALASS